MTRQRCHACTKTNTSIRVSSNIGDIATIHIRDGYLAKDIAFIKTIFGLYSEHGINQVEIVPFEGWNIELEKHNN